MQPPVYSLSLVDVLNRRMTRAVSRAMSRAMLRMVCYCDQLTRVVCVTRCSWLVSWLEQMVSRARPRVKQGLQQIATKVTQLLRKRKSGGEELHHADEVGGQGMREGGIMGRSLGGRVSRL